MNARRVAFVSCLSLAALRADAQMARWQPAKPPADTGQQLEIYGFGQADAIYDFRQNDPNWFDVNRPTKLPSFTDEFGRNHHTWLSARQSRCIAMR